jgi:hypothetical protein
VRSLIGMRSTRSCKGRVAMRFLFIYHSGRIPADATQENIDQLWQWLGNLKSRGGRATGFVANGGSSVSQSSVDDYQGNVFGISIIEAKSLDAAVKRTRGWPELRYGGHIEVLKELRTKAAKVTRKKEVRND